jgi:hypothetical protein
MLVVVVVVGKKKNKSEKGVVEVGEGRTSGSSPFLLVGEQVADAYGGVLLHLELLAPHHRPPP